MQHFMGHTIIVTVSTNRPGQGSRLPIYTITRGSQHDQVVHQHVLLEHFPSEEEARVAALAAGRAWIEAAMGPSQAGTRSAFDEPVRHAATDASDIEH